MWRADQRTLLLAATALACSLAVEPAFAQQADNLEPYQMLRSLQFVQDTVIMGDHSAGEMQRFMLGTLDKRLRTVSTAVFDDPRNVDATLIYAMSGGNPATLDYIAAKDTSGHFDNRVTDVLRKYLSGKGSLIQKTLIGMVPEYRNQRIGPYLALIAGNVVIGKEPKDALQYYDWARLGAPGTIVEEAALRRSLAIAVDVDLVEQGLSYARKYARRFVHSPYASQFADLFVKLVVKHFGEITEEDIEDTLEFMDNDRAKSILVRIARQAAIDGKNELASLASRKAEERGASARTSFDAIAKLYGGVANLSTDRVNDVLSAIANIPESELTPEDRAIREAARRIGEEVVRPPTLNSLGQDKNGNIQPQSAAVDVSAKPSNDVQGSGSTTAQNAGGPSQKLDPDFQTYVDRGQSALTAIDKMLKEGEKPR
ncbi:chemotaxis protein MotC [Rhizobium oryzicola]|uniref:Chemotaxis protein MotC n=1 Tax=Rhizobium oryzicola TaxID=1232668 RepID=A0ABT8SSI5_9HYPH|nr:chemotaxis protein MotC [Rhizobium oryzicola]MDO1581029.1 chemotaxis protein MotC [Rhizobium oryzicola]